MSGIGSKLCHPEEVADAMWYYDCCMIAHGSDFYEKHK